jgi:transcriptional regulator with XRE-family HTH domain
MTGGDMILMARRRAQLTQRELASRLGCRQATIARWERSDRQPGFKDVQDVVGACGLRLDAHLLSEDRSWWPQIVTQLGRRPVERLHQLSPPGVFVDIVAVLTALAEAHAPMIVIGEVAGALHGWPLVLSGNAVEVCARGDAVGTVLESVGASDADAGTYELPSGGRLLITDRPDGTMGYADLARGSESVEVDEREVQVAGLLDLLRIADASPDRDARRDALAYRAVLDVQHAQAEARRVDGRTGEERIQAWLREQIPVA